MDEIEYQVCAKHNSVLGCTQDQTITLKCNYCNKDLTYNEMRHHVVPSWVSLDAMRYMATMPEEKRIKWMQSNAPYLKNTHNQKKSERIGGIRI